MDSLCLIPRNRGPKSRAIDPPFPANQKAGLPSRGESGSHCARVNKDFLKNPGLTIERWLIPNLVKTRSQQLRGGYSRFWEKPGCRARIRFFLRVLSKRVPDGGDILRWSGLPFCEIDGGLAKQTDVFRACTLPNGVDELRCFLPYHVKHSPFVCVPHGCAVTHRTLKRPLP